MKHIYLLIFIAFISTVVRSQDLTIGFGLNQYSISKYSDSILRMKLPDFQSSDTILIYGHTDTIGRYRFNEELSEKRSKGIKQWLIEKNINPDKIKTYWKGESEILDFKSNEKNRRAEIFIFKDQFNSSKAEDRAFSKVPQIFEIDNLRDTIVYGNEGTSILIPKNSIVSPESFENKQFEVSVTEYYALSDIILNKLSTRTSKDILETRGMINLKIEQDGQGCTINENIPIKVGFPKSEISEDEMSLFYGKPNIDNEIIWEEAQNEVDFSKTMFVVVEEMPRFPGADSDRINFLSRNIIYPQQATEKGIEGTVYISFIVDSAGNIFNARILRGIGGGCDEEAIRTVNMMPRWIPGRLNGRNVSVLFTMPITFILNGNGKPVINQSGPDNGKYLQITDSTFRKANTNNINRYIFDVLSLGWINCDHFVYRNRPRINLNVKLKATGDISAYIIFTKSNSVLNGIYNNGYYSFNQVPKDEEIVFLAIQKAQGKCYFVQKNIKVSGRIESLDNFEEITFDDLNSRIDGIRKGF